MAAISHCNGHAELCDRAFDEVALPATHNSMSVPLPGWFASLQERPIKGQLEDGIRGLLFDTHYADRLANGRTRTYFGSAEEMQRQIQQDGVSQASVEAALRLRDRLGFRGSGERGMYLCHTFCELGSTPLADVLEDIHGFLVTHPGDVLVVINQDYVTPSDFVSALTDAGLATYAFEPPRGSAWPTLREMIEQDRRLVVLAENQAGAAPWYQLVYDRLTQETPFAFARTSELTDPGEPAGELQTEPRPRRGAAVPRQPLDQHGPAPAPRQRRHRERVRAAAAPRARLPAHPRPAGEPARRRLLRARRRVQGRRHPQRHVTRRLIWIASRICGRLRACRGRRNSSARCAALRCASRVLG